MAKRKNTKRALLASVLSMMLCMAMLIGSTFAWFTDSVTSGKNRIVAGNLDIEVTHTNKEETADLKDAANLFPVTLWEPGVVAYETFTIKNVGSLAFDYKFNFNAGDFNTVVEADGTVTDRSLRDVIKIGVIDGDAAEMTREELIAAVNAVTGDGITKNFEAFSDFNFTDYMLAGDAQSEKTFTMVAYWEPTSNDNEYNVNNGKSVSKQNDGKAELYIDITVDVIAKQRMHEEDSFGKDYDAAAKYAAVVAAINNAINQGAIDSNAAFEALLEEMGMSKDKVIYFDDALTTEEDGVKAITLHISEEALDSNEILKAGIFAVTDLIEIAVKDEITNISTVEIGYGYNLEGQVRNINGTNAPDEGWVALDLMNVLNTYGNDTWAALNEVLKKGIDVKIDDMSDGSQIYRMYFDLQGIELP